MSTRFYRAVRALVSPVLKVASRPLVLHLERAELPGGWLLAANHESPFDAALLIATTPRVIHWLSIVEIFQHPLSRWFLSSMGALPLDRRGPDPTTVRRILRLLRAGEVVGIFPEGGLQRGKLKEGVARLAEIARVPVVPCAISGSAQFSRWPNWLPLRRTRWAVATASRSNPAEIFQQSCRAPCWRFRGRCAHMSENDTGAPPVRGDHRPEPGATALCLNSSFLGFFAHAGFLDTLTQLGVRPVAISGASAGALVAGAYAAGMPPREMIQWFLTGELRRAFWEWGGALRMLGTLLDLPGHTGALRGHRALALLRDRLGDRRIEDCHPRLAIAATDLLQPQAALLTRGDLAGAILASAAFPGMFAAQRVNGSRYWDGGLANPLPFDHWLTDPAIGTIILHIVGNPESDPAPEVRARMGIRDAAGVVHEAIAAELLRLKTDLAHRAGKRLLILRTTAPRPRPWNTGRVGPQCVALGAATAAAHREELGALADPRLEFGV